MKFTHYVGYFLNPKDRTKFTVVAALTDSTAAYILLDELRKADSFYVLLPGHDVTGRELVDQKGARIKPQ